MPKRHQEPVLVFREPKSSSLSVLTAVSVSSLGSCVLKPQAVSDLDQDSDR